MGLGHKYITREIDLSEVARAYYTVPTNIDQVIKDTQTYLQETLDTGELWDEYFDLIIKHSAESVIRHLKENSNYYKCTYSIIEETCSKGTRAKISIYCYLNPFFDKKDSYYIELHSKDFIE